MIRKEYLATSDFNLLYTIPLGTTSDLLGNRLPFFGNEKPKSEKQKKKCLLPGCSNLTDHNGGYCSAEHCKQSRNKTK
jgi:hypothetical protein